MSKPYDRAFFFEFLEAKFRGPAFRVSPRTSVLKTGRKLSTATLSLLCGTWRFCIDSADGATN